MNASQGEKGGVWGMVRTVAILGVDNDGGALGPLLAFGGGGDPAGTA